METEDFLHGYRMLKACRFLAECGGQITTCEIYSSRPSMCRKFVPGKSKLCPARRNKESENET